MNPQVLIVTKPFGPPWNDATKNLARDLVEHSRAAHYTVLSTSEYSSPSPAVQCLTTFGQPGAHEPSLWQNMRTFLKLLTLDDRSIQIFHFFFRPNPLTCSMLRILKFLKPSKIFIHTLTSRPSSGINLKPSGYADQTVTLTAESHEELVGSGFGGDTLIPPCINPGELDRRAREPLPKEIADFIQSGSLTGLYPGDLSFSDAETVLSRTLASFLKPDPSRRFILACRPKTEADRIVNARLKRQFESQGLGERVLFLSTVPAFHALLAAVDFVYFPVKSLEKKMDLPLTLLESLYFKKPVLSSNLPSLQRLITPDLGACLDAADINGFIRVLDEWARNPGGLKTMGAKGHERVLVQHDPAVMAANYEALYRSVLDKSVQTQRLYYNQFSARYEKHRHEGYHKLIDDLEASVLKPLATGGDALEVGCGTGLLMERLRPHTRSLKGIDPSTAMLEIAKTKGLDVSPASADKLPFADASFDLVYSCKVFAHIPDVAGCLKEMARVTRPGGYVAVEFYQAFSFRGLRWLLRKTGLSLTQPRSPELTEKDIYTRYDTWQSLLSYRADGLKLEKLRGIMSWTPAAFCFKVPGLNRLLTGLEKAATQNGIWRPAGFVLLIFKR